MKIKDKLTTGIFLTIGISSVILITVILIFAQPYMEARTFNKFSEDKKATIIDAMFAELRIEGCR